MNNKQQTLLEFVTYEQALTLKELGFNEPCFAFYDPTNKKLEIVGNLLNYNFISDIPDILKLKNPKPKDISAPTFSQAFRFFREKYDGVCEITRKEDGNHSEFIGWIFIDNKRINVVSYWGSKTYEETESACLDKLIDLLMSNKVMSNPKEKAIELFFKYRNLENKDSYINNYNATKCALIAVEQLIYLDYNSLEYYGILNSTQYWEEVKQEIEKL